MEIVNHQRLAAVIELGDQGDAAAFASLEQRHAGDQQTPRLPESGLMFEADHARSAHRQGGEKRLAVIGRVFSGTLAQFPKFGRENVVHAEALGQFLGDVFAVSAPRPQIHLLKDAQIGFQVADLIFDVVEMLSAIDVPIQDGGMGVKAGAEWA